MVLEYTERGYEPLGRAYFELGGRTKEGARQRAQRAQHIRRAFAAIEFVGAQVVDPSRFKVGDPFEARAAVDLGELRPAAVAVELRLGHAAGDQNLANMVTVELTPTGEPNGSVQAFEATHTIDRSGPYGYGLRVRARHGDSAGGTLHDLVLWA